MKILITSSTCIILSSILIYLASTISKKSTQDREKNSPFECGFDPKASSRTPFRLQFFLIAVIFLIFDVEIALLLPITIIIKFSQTTYWTTVRTTFIFIL